MQFQISDDALARMPPRHTINVFIMDLSITCHFILTFSMFELFTCVTSKRQSEVFNMKEHLFLSTERPGDVLQKSLNLSSFASIHKSTRTFAVEMQFEIFLEYPFFMNQLVFLLHFPFDR